MAEYLSLCGGPIGCAASSVVQERLEYRIWVQSVALRRHTFVCKVNVTTAWHMIHHHDCVKLYSRPAKRQDPHLIRYNVLRKKQRKISQSDSPIVNS